MKRNILTIFLASPGDLKEEREITRNTINRLNKVISKGVGWQIELLGWEDTLPGYSRPQALINKDVDSCDLFLGILWKRWGQKTGEYSSGFEEEFIRARERRKESDQPEIWLFFKNIDEEAKNDPGPQLKKVVKFKNEQIQLKELLFKEFGESAKWGELIYDDLLAYVFDKSKVESNKEVQEKSIMLNRSGHDYETQHSEISENNQKYPSELINLYNEISRKLNSGEKISFDKWDRTRIFLSTSMWFSEVHLGEFLGNHEMNLAYVRRKEWKLSGDEILFLFRSFISDEHGNRPGWYWFKDFEENDIDTGLLSFVFNDINLEVRCGALKTLVDTGYKAKLEYIERGLKDDNEEIVLNMINLMKNDKKSEYLDLLEPIIKTSKTQIKKTAIKTKIEILFLDKPDKAFSYLINTKSKIPSFIQDKISEGNLHVEKNLLIKAVEVAEISVRRFCAEYLRKSKLMPM